jgi:hypothetical protein
MFSLLELGVIVLAWLAVVAWIIYHVKRNGWHE